jgi:hypothetical protein
MYDRTIVTYNKSNRLKDLPKREQDMASSIQMASKSDGREASHHLTQEYPRWRVQA